VDVTANGRSVGVEVVCEGSIEAEELAYEHVRYDAVELVVGIAVRHLYDEVGFDAREFGFLATDDDDLCHGFVVGVHLANEITFVTLYILLIGHEVHHDRLAVDNCFGSVTEAEEAVELAYHGAVGEFL
jgi:hypothetical protein